MEVAAAWVSVWTYALSRSSPESTSEDAQSECCHDGQGGQDIPGEGLPTGKRGEPPPAWDPEPLRVRPALPSFLHKPVFCLGPNTVLTVFSSRVSILMRQS